MIAEQVTCSPGMIVYGQVVVAVTPFASVTSMEKEPAAVGVPEIAPVDVFRVKPAGNVPTTENVYGAVPPVTVSGPLLNGTPTSPVVPLARHVNCGGGTIVYGQVVVAVTPFASVTWMENEPAAVGVPEIAPVDVFRVKPAGNVPTTENVYGAVPPVTVSGPLLNGTPTSPVVPLARHVNCGGGVTVTEQLIVPTLPAESVIVTV